MVIKTTNDMGDSLAFKKKAYIYIYSGCGCDIHIWRNGT